MERGCNMPKNRIIIVRVTKAQHERIANNAEAKGHKTISDYVRSSILGFDMITETKINKIFEVIVEKKDRSQDSLEESDQHFAEA